MAKENGEKPILEFDLMIMTAEEFGAFIGSVKGPEHIQKMSDSLARLVKKCPAEWGPKEDPQTYMQLSWFGVWKKVIFPGFREALKNDESE